ncbi:hypothetical protein EYC80_004425 [Monilinia laxa]|uniref:Uncharacterized protein n=1 Tax=Monilinia laxa TaxID=61186 RepID=A0A5N6KMR5_MONLA|nr:hypothetical protein EYC80_004425 [Monilinia laxa]
MYRNWILSRPRNGLIQGSLVTLQNSVTSTQLSLNTTNALIILRNIWEQIEIDVKDAFGNTFMGEIYLIVVEVWTFKYYINNLVRSSKGLPQTTFSDAITEISRYTISQPFQPINPHPQPNSVATNNGITHRPSLLSIALGNTHKVADAQIQSRSSISSNPNHLAENQSQHKNSNTMVPNIKLEVNNEQKQGLPRIAARTHSAPAPSNQRHSDARTLRISAAATQSHFGAPNNPATYVGDTQLKRSATVSRDNGTITNYPSQNIKVESDTTLADTFSSPRRHGRALTNPEVAGFDTPASTHIKKERS